MKLANALSERADVQKRLQQLAVRMNNNAKVQEGQKPAEDPAALLKELDALCARITEMMTEALEGGEPENRAVFEGSLAVRRSTRREGNA